MIKEGNVKMTAKEFYETIGQNYEEVLERLAGSEALVLRFLKKFSTDKTFSELEKAMEARDIEMIFRQSHTLKGVAPGTRRTSYGSAENRSRKLPYKDHGCNRAWRSGCHNISS